MAMEVVQGQCNFSNVLHRHIKVKISIDVKKRFHISTNEVLHYLEKNIKWDPGVDKN